MPRRLAVPAALLLLAAPALGQPNFFGPSYEPTHAELAVANAGFTGLLALARAAASGNVESVPDALGVFATGAVGGTGFYAAKRLVGEGDFVGGVALAYASASLVENVASGGHPLGHVRAGFGPAEVRLRTPFAQGSGPRARVEVDPFATAALVALPAFGQGVFVRGGVLGYQDTGSARAIGRVFTADVARRDVVAHELIHVLQSVQIHSVSPYGSTSALDPSWALTSADGAVVWDVRLDGLRAVIGLIQLPVPYRDRPTEVEAFELVDIPVNPGCPPGVFCPLGGQDR